MLGRPRGGWEWQRSILDGKKSIGLVYTIVAKIATDAILFSLTTKYADTADEDAFDKKMLWLNYELQTVSFPGSIRLFLGGITASWGH